MKTIVHFTSALLVLLFVLTINKAEAVPAVSANILASPAIVADSTYQVQQGDTYYSLSRRFNIPVETLQQWNGPSLKAGQTLYLTEPTSKAVPKAITASTTATPPSTVRKANPSPAQGSTSASANPLPTTAEFKTRQRILVVPFDPYLYFSDADYEIARQSKIPRQNVRQVFRGRLDALMAPKGYETIHLLGGVYRDSVSEMQSLYKSLHYSYQDNKESVFNKQPVVKEKEGSDLLVWAKRQKEKLGIKSPPVASSDAQNDSKHYGVEVKDPNFFSHFNSQYGIDYYVFINQFEVTTNYENCLDRAAMNYERSFLVHYSIYDSSGKLVSGNKVKVPYQSNMNDIHRIASDNLPSMARKVLADLPKAH
ncbi:LysM domain-containing protein [Pontibacter sp. SGAir0037]|uniref:LysM peptidoglycan-binding domain-containing protein n=1 Tax=Pontibacter sp. SGAir0037 TaxID=2571030 RepID=UPI0010CCFEB8|nr:LysM domain-containing protein [Pontibacter sp. SGAir0037]QCR20904.1 peptidoglycan-binding protein [Pontibacter sp. SGAir0037]